MHPFANAENASLFHSPLHCVSHSSGQCESEIAREKDKGAARHGRQQKRASPFVVVIIVVPVVVAASQGSFWGLLPPKKHSLYPSLSL